MVRPVLFGPPPRIGSVSTISNGSVTALETPRMPAQRNRLKDTPVAGTKRVLLAAPRGYCAGVDRAVIAVEKALERYGAPVYVRKQIVHNIHVVTTLEKQGAIFVDEVEEVPEGAHVVFSAHGVSPAVVQGAADRNLQAIDATCPLVTKVHMEVARHGKAGRDVVLIGHAGHPEVEGTMGQWDPANAGAIHLVETPECVDKIVPRNPEHIAFATQTTLSIDDTKAVIEALQRTGGNKSKTARLLGISRSWLYEKMARLGIGEAVKEYRVMEAKDRLEA